MSETAKSTEMAMFGAGCFWGVEQAFRELPGVLDAEVGYAGGQTDNPTYEQVCSDGTGHAEVCQVKFDPEQISYEKLLERFWTMHNPTTLNRQGPDHGSQYRSGIYTYTPAQALAAEGSKEQWQSKFPRPIVTEILPAPQFYRAEEYHQRYFAKTGRGSCHV